MNVFVDYCGHSDLYHSLYVLFEKRLGYNLYCPEGIEWVEKGFLSHHTIRDMDHKYECEKDEIIDGVQHYHRKMEEDKGYYDIKSLSFDQFIVMDIDLIVTSVYFNEPFFYNLIKIHKPNAKFVRQIANIHERPLEYCKNILLGAAYHASDYGHRPPEAGFKAAGINGIIYYPEQYEGYHYTDPINHKLIINLAPHLSPADFVTWEKVQEELKDHGFTFQMFGRGNLDSQIDTIPHLELPSAMKQAGFIWYTKPNGGGGYTVRQAMACGRPVIIRRSYSVAHSDIECQLFRHGVNCIDLDIIIKNESYDLALFKEWSEPSTHKEVCKRVAEQFQEDTKFAETAEKIRSWLDALPRGVV